MSHNELIWAIGTHFLDVHFFEVVAVANALIADVVDVAVVVASVGIVDHGPQRD